MLALVLAGTAEENDLTRLAGVRNKSFISLGGKTVLAYILEVLEQAESISRIIVVGPEESLLELKGEYNFDIVPEEGSIARNIHAPYNRGMLKGPFLLVTGDIPLLSMEALEDFLKQCSPYDLDFYYPIIPKEAIERSYPATKRTYVPLMEGVFTGGNIFIVRAEKIQESLPQVEDFIRLRKSFVKMMSKLGIVFIVKYITRRLVIEDLVKRCRILFNVEAKAVVTWYPEIGTDMDKASDLEFFQQQLGG